MKDYLNKEINANRILQYLSDEGIIDLANVQEQIKMKKREELLSKHKYSITECADGYCRTYIPKPDGGRKLIKRKSRKDVENIIIEFYRKKEEESYTFDSAYWDWRKIKDELVGDNTVTKYNTDYLRYFKEKEFSKKLIREIADDDITVFIVQTVKTLKLCKEACKTLYGYINNVIKHAKKNKVITENPMEFMKAADFYKYCAEINKQTSDRVISDTQMKLLYEQFEKDHKKNPNYIPTYAVELASLTGMRVGELAALKWENIHDMYILINSSEKYNKKTKEYYIDTTKNKKSRKYPITKEIRNLLERVKRVELQNGTICEWVFANEEGRIHTQVISSCAKNKCIQLGIPVKSVHSYRRTLNSKMRCNGVSSTVAASLFGHSKEVNEKYYTYDITDMDDKRQIVSMLNSQTHDLSLAK